MKGFRLTDAQIRQRLQEGRNYKRLYFELKVKYDALLLENKQLRLRLAEQEAKLETQAARIEQLEAMVFGRKPPGNGQTKLRLRAKRSARLYRRPIPKDDEVTAEEHLTVHACKHCGGPLTDIQAILRFIEDIALAALGTASLKTVTKQTIERGWCGRCGKFSSAADPRGQEVSIGPNVRLLIGYLSTIVGLSFEQTQRLLMDCYHFQITDGEFEQIFYQQRIALLPSYEKLKNSIRAGPSNVDETRYPIQSEQGSGYGWVMTGADGTSAENDIVYKLADNRGKGNTIELLGTAYAHTGITDRYAGYKAIFVTGKHQICWAHLARNARDITKLECLSEAKQACAKSFYEALNGIYALVRRYHAQAFDAAIRAKQAKELLPAITSLCRPSKLDPKQLADLKAGILAYRDCLFVCLTETNVPPDNNKAERRIRQLVMKRKRSFGVKTPKGARALEVLMSVYWSLWYRDRNNFFHNLQRQLLRV